MYNPVFPQLSMYYFSQNDIIFPHSQLALENMVKPQLLCLYAETKSPTTPPFVCLMLWPSHAFFLDCTLKSSVQVKQWGAPGAPMNSKFNCILFSISFQLRHQSSQLHFQFSETFPVFLRILTIKEKGKGKGYYTGKTEAISALSDQLVKA